MINNNDKLSGDIETFKQYFDYQMDFSMMKRQFKVFNQIMSKLEHMTLEKRFPYVLELLDSFSAMDDGNDDLYDEYMEVKDMMYYGILQKEKFHLSWFWKQMEHPSIAEEDLIALFFDLYDETEAVPLLQHQITLCTDSDDIAILIPMLCSYLESLPYTKIKQIMMPYEASHSVWILYSTLHEKEGNHLQAIADMKQALSCQMDNYERFNNRKRLYQLSFAAKDPSCCLECFADLLTFNKKQALLYYKRVRKLLVNWKEERQAYLDLLQQAEIDIKPILLLENMRDELYDILQTSIMTLNELMQYDICYLPKHKEELYTLYHDELQMKDLIHPDPSFLQAILDHLKTLPEGEYLANRLLETFSQ